MKGLNIITPVKDSIELTLETIKATLASEISVPFTYTVYNDFSTPENTAILEKASKEMGFRLVNLSDITDHPSPNYLLVLKMTREESIGKNWGLAIVESDVIVKKDTFQKLYEGAVADEKCAIAASVTVDEKGEINYPYLPAKGKENMAFKYEKHCSFCCSLLTNNLLKAYDFHTLNPEKHWFDVTISQQSRALGFTNYLFANLSVIHRPHASRPWKQLKYTNPLKYYWIKFTKGFDKI